MMRRLAPYVIAVAGAVVVTIAIGLVSMRFEIPGLSALYLLLVLWLGATWGRGPAVAGSFAAFLLYDYFFVPPVGTFAVRGQTELLELVVLLAVALVTGQLAGSLRRTQSAAEALATDERAMYELATAALRSPEVTVALGLLSERAMRLQGVSRFALVAMDFGSAVPLAGGDESADEIRQAMWSYENKRPIGVALSKGAVRLMKTSPESKEPAYLPLASGVAVMTIDPGASEPGDLRMLAALVGACSRSSASCSATWTVRRAGWIGSSGTCWPCRASRPAWSSSASRISSQTWSGPRCTSCVPSSRAARSRSRSLTTCPQSRSTSCRSGACSRT